LKVWQEVRNKPDFIIVPCFGCSECNKKWGLVGIVWRTFGVYDGTAELPLYFASIVELVPVNHFETREAE